METSHDGASMHIVVAKKGSDGLVGGDGDGVNSRGLEECMYIRIHSVTRSLIVMVHNVCWVLVE